MLRLLFLGREVHCGSKAEALRCARELCDREGIAWAEPVSIHWYFWHWVVWTHANYIGGNVEILVNIRTGKARRVLGPLPR
jgi:hypothetical protein